MAAQAQGPARGRGRAIRRVQREARGAHAGVYERPDAPPRRRPGRGRQGDRARDLPAPAAGAGAGHALGAPGDPAIAGCTPDRAVGRGDARPVPAAAVAARPRGIGGLAVRDLAVRDPARRGPAGGGRARSPGRSPRRSRRSSRIVARSPTYSAIVLLAHPSGDPHERLHDQLVLGGVRQGADEVAVDLQVVERERASGTGRIRSPRRSRRGRPHSRANAPPRRTCRARCMSEIAAVSVTSITSRLGVDAVTGEPRSMWASIVPSLTDSAERLTAIRDRPGRLRGASGCLPRLPARARAPVFEVTTIADGPADLGAPTRRGPSGRSRGSGRSARRRAGTARGDQRAGGSSARRTSAS